MQRLLLFDIDGTLIAMQRGSSREVLHGVLQEIFAQPLPDALTIEVAGKTDLQIFDELARALEIPDASVKRYWPAVQAALTKYTRRLVNENKIRLLDGVTEIVRRSAAHPTVALGLLTGNIRQAAYLKLEPYGLDGHFPFGAFGCDHSDRAELPLIAVERAIAHHDGAWFAEHNTTIIGDTTRDIACARANNMRAVVVATGGTSKDELARHEPDALFDDFSKTDAVCDILFP